MSKSGYLARQKAERDWYMITAERNPDLKQINYERR